jgi:predicted ArsR family transcriptional regulator
VSAVNVVRAALTGADTERRILEALAPEPLPLHAVAERVGHSTLAVEVFLRYLRARGAVVRAPGADGVLVWRAARAGGAT